VIDWLLYTEAGFWVGSALIFGGIIVLAGYFGWRYGGVTLGEDPPQRQVLSDATTVILPVQPYLPNYVRTEEYRSELADWFPMAPTVDLTPAMAAVAAYFEKVETVTVTRGVVITIPARHRAEDVHSPTIDITSSVQRARAAKELTG
jgi:hypothetical protein